MKASANIALIDSNSTPAHTLPTVETAYGAAINHGGIVVVPKRQSRKATTEITEDEAVGKHGGEAVGGASSTAPVGDPPELKSSLQIANEPAAQEAAHANTDPGEEVTVRIDDRTCIEPEFIPPQLSVADGQNRQSTNGLPMVTLASRPESTASEDQPLGPGTVFRLVDGREIFITTASESDLITEKKLRAILQVSVACGDKDAIGVEGLTRRQRPSFPRRWEVLPALPRLRSHAPNQALQRTAGWRRWRVPCFSPRRR